MNTASPEHRRSSTNRGRAVRRGRRRPSATATLSARAVAAIGTAASVLFLLGGVLIAIPEKAASEQASQPGTPAAAGLDAGRAHSCALVGGGSVHCWGLAATASLATPTPTRSATTRSPALPGPWTSAPAARPPPSRPASPIPARCSNDARVRCWGFGADGELGYGNTNAIGDDEPPGCGRAGQPRRRAHRHRDQRRRLPHLRRARRWRACAAGATASLASSANGSDDHDRRRRDARRSLGQWTSATGAPPPRSAPAPAIPAPCSTAATCAAGATASTASSATATRPRSATIETPGSVGPVNLGAGPHRDRDQRRRLPHLRAARQRQRPLLGLQRTTASSATPTRTRSATTRPPDTAGPVNLGPGRTAIAISAGGFHTCALLDDGSVRCWGYGAEGRLGYGEHARRSATTRRRARSGRSTSDPGARRWRSAPAAPTPVRGSTTASVRCWGYGGNGRLGLCGSRNIGDDEPPGAAGPIMLTPPAGRRLWLPRGRIGPRARRDPAPPLTPTRRAFRRRRRGCAACAAASRSVRRHATARAPACPPSLGLGSCARRAPREAATRPSCAVAASSAAGARPAGSRG